MRLGVFGGTFDPVHVGHLILAEQCREQGKLDQVLFVPAARPPHKEEQALTPFDKRVEMLALALSGQPAFRIEDIEKDRPGPSYTVETLAQLKSKYPDAELVLVIGSDTLQDLPRWHQPEMVVRFADLLVVPRLGWPTKKPEGLAARIQEVVMPLIEISSRDLRARVFAGRSVRYMIPRAVEAYVEDKGLYR